MDELILAESYNEVSRRHAILSCDGSSAWLYLHEPTDDPTRLQPVDSSGCAFNVIPPITKSEIQDFQPSPPPIVKNFASEIAICDNPSDFAWEMTWSNDGQSVLVRRDGCAWCFLTPDNKQGFSKAIAADGPWGKPWNDEAFAEITWGHTGNRG